MGPTNIALVKLSQADKQWRSALARLEAASHSIRVQERRLSSLREQLSLAQNQLRESQSQSGQFDLDIKTRDEHIEKLRTQQQNARNNKEYQAFLTEISAEKIEKAKAEEELIKVMEIAEKQGKEVDELQKEIQIVNDALQANQKELSGKLSAMQAEVDALKPVRDKAAAEVPAKAREAFERLAGRYEEDAMVPISKPDRRHEEYICSACNMSLVTDIYNLLHSRDELVFCPNCRKILYIPDDLPPELAIGSGRVETPRKPAASSRRRKSAEQKDAPERDEATPAT